MSELKACQLCGHPENVDTVSVNAVPMAPTPEASRLRELESALAKAREERDQYAEEARMMSDRLNRLVRLGKENEALRGAVKYCADGELNCQDHSTAALLAKREAPATKKKCRPCGATGFVQDTEGPRICPTCGGFGYETST